jgi:low temperature requirement protein LtrA
MTDDPRSSFRRWLWSPPRPHGAIIPDRTVSFLELFYDLVYVAVITQAAHRLHEDVTLGGVFEFGIVFALIWIAWVNGSLYLELHGREDGRTRSAVFVQMGILALLAVFTAGAADGSGRSFALVYATFLVVMTWLWNAVRRQDRRDRPDFLPITGRYVTGMGVSVIVILASAILPTGPRLIVWAGFAIAWIVGILLLGRRSRPGANPGVAATDSLVERFGLFTIIVLGEVIFGVVDGLSLAEHDATTIWTGTIALVLGFGFWWIYFDVVGRRLPRNDGRSLTNWTLSHLPITLSIAAGGAGMAGLIEHAHDAATPTSTAWLLAGAVAVGLLALVVTARSLVDAERLVVVYRPLSRALAGGAAAALVVGWLRPAPWLLALMLVAILSVLWVFAVSRFLRAGAWTDARPPAGASPGAD